MPGTTALVRASDVTPLVTWRRRKGTPGEPPTKPRWESPGGAWSGTAPPRGAARARPSPLLRCESHPLTKAIRIRIDVQLIRMARRVGSSLMEPPFVRIRERATRSLGRIADHLHAGALDPRTPLRLCAAEETPLATERTARLGVYPVTGNPLHWGHVLCALEAIAELRLDTVALVVQGIDRRKRAATEETQGHRHEMARRVVRLLEPLVRYSDVGWRNERVGEDNLFQLLRWNGHQPLVAHYLVGADHYRLSDPSGNPDTLPRLERNMADPRCGFDGTRHDVRAVFVARGERGPEVPTTLEVMFLDETLDSSSTAVRDGDIALTPYAAYRYIEAHRAYARTLGIQTRA